MAVKNFGIIMATLCLASPLLAGKVKLVDDPPAAAKPRPGRLTGRITPPGKLQTLTAVSRVTTKRYLPDSWDKKTGEFTFPPMPGDARYDLCVTTTDGREIEGIDLDFVGSRLARLAELRRKQLALPTKKKPRRFTPAAVEAIQKFLADWEDFMDTRRILYIRGHGDKATVLVELMRLREFHASVQHGEPEGDIVWRIELWYMEKRGGGWERIPNVERVLRRLRIKPAEWRLIHVEYYPALSVRIEADGTSKPLNVTLGDKPDESRGRVANSTAKLKTKPHVIGLDEKKKIPAGDSKTPATNSKSPVGGPYVFALRASPHKSVRR